jgi:hypothetical protein
MLITVTLEGTLSTLLLTEIELFQLPATDMTVTSGNGTYLNLVYTSKM